MKILPMADVYLQAPTLYAIGKDILAVQLIDIL